MVPGNSKRNRYNIYRVRYLKQQGGFTILEMIAVATFVSIAFVAIVQIFITIQNLNRQNRNLTDAKLLAQQKIEQYRDSAYADIPTGTPAVTFTSELPDALKEPRSATIDITEVETGLKKIDVYISYKDPTTKRVELTTYVTEEGINR